MQNTLSILSLVLITTKCIELTNFFDTTFKDILGDSVVPLALR